MRWYETIVAAHIAVTDDVGHGGYTKTDRYFVWQEDGANDLVAEGVHIEKAVAGSTDLFTKKEFDPWKWLLEESLTAHGIYWMLNSVQHEEETGFWHYEWRWEVLDGG